RRRRLHEHRRPTQRGRQLSLPPSQRVAHGRFLPLAFGPLDGRSLPTESDSFAGPSWLLTPPPSPPRSGEGCLSPAAHTPWQEVTPRRMPRWTEAPSPLRGGG